MQVRNVSDPASLAGLSVATVFMAMVSNGLMVPRALLTRDAVWLTGSSWACFTGWAQLASLFAAHAPSGSESFALDSETDATIHHTCSPVCQRCILCPNLFSGPPKSSSKTLEIVRVCLGASRSPFLCHCPARPLRWATETCDSVSLAGPGAVINLSLKMRASLLS